MSYELAAKWFRLEWSADLDRAVVSVDQDYVSGPFVADCTLPTVDGSNNGFGQGVSSRIYIGGDWDNRFDDFQVQVDSDCDGTFDPPAPTLSCVGFEPPMASGPVKVKKNKVLPLKAQLFDSDGIAITDAAIVAHPVVQVLFNSGSEPAVDVTADSLPAGLGDDGNQLVYTGARWQYNLKTQNYTASGIYSVSMASGDDTEYVIDPECVAQFVIE